MPYILNKTNGTIVATVQDASLDLSTDLIFVGRNYAGYGEWQNENFLKLLENFANTIPPTKPIDGQQWYDSTNRRLNVWDGEDWKSISNLDVNAQSLEASKRYQTGDLWFDSREQQLHAFNGSEFILIGPPSGADTRAYWKGDLDYSSEDPGTPKYNIKAIIGANNEVSAIVSAETYTVSQAEQSPFPKYPIFDSSVATKIVKGITLPGSNAVTGRSSANTTTGYMLWGTAAHALVASEADRATGVDLTTSPSVGNFPIPYLNTGTGIVEASAIYADSSFHYNPLTKTVNADFFDGIATSAYYADLAERYEADAVYDEGTVVVIGGVAEVTVTTKRANVAVAGVVSINPAFKMNSGAGSDLTHPYIALKGRIPCKVIGPVKKGQLLVTSHRDGYAEVWKEGDDPNAVIGKALENFEGLYGMIEVKI